MQTPRPAGVWGHILGPLTPSAASGNLEAGNPKTQVKDKTRVGKLPYLNSFKNKGTAEMEATWQCLATRGRPRAASQHQVDLLAGALRMRALEATGDRCGPGDPAALGGTWKGRPGPGVPAALGETWRGLLVLGSLLPSGKTWRGRPDPGVPTALREDLEGVPDPGDLLPSGKTWKGFPDPRVSAALGEDLEGVPGPGVPAAPPLPDSPSL